MKIICFFKTIWRSLGRGMNLFLDGTPISGHDYIDTEIHENCQVTISKCEICGDIDISWKN